MQQEIIQLGGTLEERAAKLMALVSALETPTSALCEEVSHVKVRTLK
jgi:hypothetical protein